MDPQSFTLAISAVGTPLANLAVPTKNPALLRGLPFNIDASKSTFKMISTGANTYEVWFKEMEDIDPMMDEDVTDGLVHRGSFYNRVLSLNSLDRHVLVG